MKNRAMIIYYISFFLIIVAMLITAMLFPGMDLKINIVEPPVLNEGWKVELSGNTAQTDSHLVNISSDQINIPANLPYRLPVDGGTTVSLKRVLGSAFDEPQGILMRGSLQDVIVYLDEEMIYERVFRNESAIVLPYASTWNTFSIPADSNGKTLRIELYSPFDGMAGQISEVYYGQSSLLQIYLLKTYGPGLLISVLIFIIGLILTISPLLFRRMEYSENSAVGSFAMITAIYLITEGRLLDFLTGNQFILGGMAYITLALIPIPLLIFMREIACDKNKRIFSILTIAHFADALLILILQITGIAGFFESLIITHGLLSLTALVSIYILFVESRQNKNKDARQLLQGLLVMVLFGLMELLYFYLFDYVQVSFFLRTGVLLFVAILSVQSISRIGNVRRKIFQSELYEKLAFTDQLTKAPNRMAFDRDLYVLFQKPPSDYIHVGFYDLNNLKTINDRFGHKYGDDAIIRSYAVISDVFSNFGSCYRIGGDEFACILIGPDKQTLDSMAEELNSKVNEAGRDLFYPFVLAQGYAELNRRMQTTVDELMHEADKNMYQDKLLKKSISPLPSSFNEPVS